MNAGDTDRRRFLLAAAGAGLAGAGGCRRSPPPVPPAQWVGDSAERGHRLHTHLPDARGGAPSGAPSGAPAVRRAQIVVVGAGVAGLAAARALGRRGLDDLAVLDLESQPGGNSRGHRMAGLDCPLGAHYLPLPGPHALAVSEWLHEIGLLHTSHGRSVPDERHLCHSPQERLFIDGAWHDGLLPPAEPGGSTLIQYQAWAGEVARAQTLGFAIPTARARWSAALAELDGQTFATWLDARGLRDERLRWYLDYACRDEYGADASTVSAWAGLHYFAGRQGFHAPGDDAPGRDAVFTWPEGNAWLIRRLAQPLAGRLHAGRLVHAVRVEREGVQVDAWDIASGRPERWQARAVVVAVPLFVAARLLADPPPALVAAASRMRYAPWLVANLALREPLLDRGLGAPASWDNVRYGSPSLGYVDAGHQRLSPAAGPTVITAYWPLTTTERSKLLADTASDWGHRITADLQAAHPDLPEKVQQIDLARHGHAMSIPVPGTRGSTALAALRELRGPVQFAHADLAGYSVFEEAFEQGERAARTLAGR